MMSSSLWPEDLDATRATKTAFYLKFSYGLKSKHRLKSVVARDWLDVYVGGFAFRVVLYHAREILMLRHRANTYVRGAVRACTVCPVWWLCGSLTMYTHAPPPRAA